MEKDLLTWTRATEFVQFPGHGDKRFRARKILMRETFSYLPLLRLAYSCLFQCHREGSKRDSLAGLEWFEIPRQSSFGQPAVASPRQHGSIR